MKTITINKRNMSGEKGKISLYADGLTFKIYDYKFRLKRNLTPLQEKKYDVSTDFYVYSIDGEWDEKFPMCRVYQIEIRGKKQFIGNSYGIERENDQDPRIAAALVLFNTI